MAINIITITTTTVEPSSGEEPTLPPNGAVLISEALGERVWINTSPLVTGLVDFSGSEEMPTGEFFRGGERAAGVTGVAVRETVQEGDS